MNKVNISNSAILPVFLTIACFLLSWYLVLPNYYKAKGELDILEQEILAARAKYNSLETTKEDLASMADVMEIIYVSVSKGADEPNLITELEAISLKHELIIPSIGISDRMAETGEDGYNYNEGEVAQSPGAVQVSFSVVGDFSKLNEFISSLESSIKFMNIKSLSYSTSDADGLIYLSIQLETYKY